MRGNITRRGKASWRLKFDLGTDPATGARQTRFVTVKGRRPAAERELTRLLNTADQGTFVDPSKTTVAEYIREWLAGADGLSAKTAERYRQLAEQQIIPHLGAITLQKLKPTQVQTWHRTLAKSGGKSGRPLSSRTVGHAHRVLHRALARAVASEAIARNVATVIRPPKVEAEEVATLSAGQIAEVLPKMDGHALGPIVTLAVSTGARRGELCGLRWCDTDVDGATIKIERSMEETAEGLRVKAPKTKHARRVIALPASAVEALRAHRRRQLEQRLSLGLGRPDAEALVFAMPDGSPLPPDRLSRDWGLAVAALKLPKVTFHGLRHSHASALIAAKVDVLTISRRLGHGSPATTLNVYAHRFSNTDETAAQAIEAAIRTGAER